MENKKVINNLEDWEAFQCLISKDDYIFDRHRGEFTDIEDSEKGYVTASQINVIEESYGVDLQWVVERYNIDTTKY